MNCRWLAVILLTGLSQDAASAPDSLHWTFLSEDEGLYLESLEVPGRDLPILRARGVLHENMYEILAVLNDFDSHTLWMKNMSVSEPIERRSDFEILVYNVFDSPWPIQDRDLVMRVDIDYRPVEKIVALHFNRVQSEARPPVDGIVRVPHVNIYARLKYIGPKATKIIYRVDVDPGGSIPRFIVRWFARRVPLQALQRMRLFLEKSRGNYEPFLNKWDPTRASHP